MQARNSPYELKKAKQDGCYLFSTRYKVEYAIELSDYSDWFGIPSKDFPGNKGWHLGLRRLDESILAPLDPRIKATVTTFALDYLEKQRDDFLLYVCSAIGGKENQRRNTFDRWFNTSKGKLSTIQKIRKIIEDQEIHFLYREDRPAIAQLFDKIDLYNALPSFLVKS